jgi:hypothetical protein
MPLKSEPVNGLLYQPRMTDEENEVFGEIKIIRKK